MLVNAQVMPIPTAPLSPPSSGFKSKIRKVFRTTSGPDRSFSLVSQLTSAALCASSPALPKSSQVPPVVKSLLRPLSVPQLRCWLWFFANFTLHTLQMTDAFISRIPTVSG